MLIILSSPTHQNIVPVRGDLFLRHLFFDAYSLALTFALAFVLCWLLYLHIAEYESKIMVDQ